ncbi:MAG TPA: TIGR02757 family protein, partial [Chitinophagaceae bacterium]
AWGGRTIIINKSKELMALMDGSPYDFIVHHKEEDRKRFLHFKHRTFNATDLLYFIDFLQHHYRAQPSLEAAFLVKEKFISVEASLNHFHSYFFRLPEAPPRTGKHIAAPFKGSSCKRLNMFLRWMVRHDDKGVDFGIWNQIPQGGLICPIDVHVARVAKKLGLLHRNAVDWLAALELTHQLRQLDEADPVKYDFALFGLGVGEKF